MTTINPISTFIGINQTLTEIDVLKEFLKYDASYKNIKEYPTLNKVEEWKKIFLNELSVAENNKLQAFKRNKMWNTAYAINTIVVIGVMIGAMITIATIGEIAFLGILGVSALSNAYCYRKAKQTDKDCEKFATLHYLLQWNQRAATSDEFFSWAKDHNCTHIRSFREFITWLDLYRHSENFNQLCEKFIALSEESEKLSPSSPRYSEIKEELSVCKKEIRQLEPYRGFIFTLRKIIVSKKQTGKMPDVFDTIISEMDDATTKAAKLLKEKRRLVITRAISVLALTILLAAIIFVASTMPLSSSIFMLKTPGDVFCVLAASVGGLLLGYSTEVTTRIKETQKGIDILSHKYEAKFDQKKMCRASKEFKDWLMHHKIKLTPWTLLPASNLYLLKS